MEVIEVGVGDEDEIDERHQIEAEPGLALSFHDAVPLCPVGVDDDRVIGELHQKCGVANPGDPDFSCFRGVWDRGFH